MYEALSNTLSTAIKFLHLGDVRIDTWVFRLHYVLRWVGIYSAIINHNFPP